MKALRAWMLTAGLMSLLSACNEAPQEPVPAPSLSLTDAPWILRSVHSGKSTWPVHRSDYVLNFTDSGVVYAQLGCNQLSSAYLATASTVRLTGEGVMTLMACEDDPFSDEMRAALNKEVADYSIQDSTLCLSHGDQKACFSP